MVDTGLIAIGITVFAGLFSFVRSFGRDEAIAKKVAEIQSDQVKQIHLDLNANVSKTIDLERELAVLNTKLGGDYMSLNKEVIDLKDTLKEFTKEMRLWKEDIIEKIVHASTAQKKRDI